MPADFRQPGQSTRSPEEAERPKLRILFDLAFPGYLRYFDAAIRELTERGHEVEVWFDRANKQADAVRVLDGQPSVHVGGQLPHPEDGLKRTTRLARSLADYCRYLDRRFADALYLRERAGAILPPIFKPLRRLRALPDSLVSSVVRVLLELEQGLARSPALEAFLREKRFDVAVAAPNVYFNSAQADLLASAKALGIPTVAALASWDNLTTKGLIRGDPDAVVVWNEMQRREAVDFHRIPHERIVVTGAYPFDKWFARSPSRTAAAFKRQVGLSEDSPYILFVGSTASISAPDAEQKFVCEWLRALRAAPDPALRELSVLVRPHPYNSEHWSEFDLSSFGPVTIWPPVASDPLTDPERDDFFDSLHHAAAVVGVNTSAMIEAAIVGRPVLTVTRPEFGDTQTGTLHFQHLLPENGGFLRRAGSLDDHLTQLGDVLANSNGADECAAFVSSFIRPLGLNQPATTALANAIERTAQAGSLGKRSPATWTKFAIGLFQLLDAINRFLPSHGGERKKGGRASRQGQRVYRAFRNRVPQPIRRVAQPLVRAIRRSRTTSVART